MKAQAVLFSLLMLLVQVWPWGFISATTADWVMAPSAAWPGACAARALAKGQLSFML